MFEVFFREKIAPLVLRLAVGLVGIHHGFLKIMADGGTTWTSGMTTFWQLVVAWGEFAAGLAILLGFRCRIAATLMLALTAGTLLWWQGWNVFHLPIATLEPTLLLMMLALSLVFIGAGDLSLDGRAIGRSPGPAKVAKKAA